MSESVQGSSSNPIYETLANMQLRTPPRNPNHSYTQHDTTPKPVSDLPGVILRNGRRLELSPESRTHVNRGVTALDRMRNRMKRRERARDLRELLTGAHPDAKWVRDLSGRLTRAIQKGGGDDGIYTTPYRFDHKHAADRHLFHSDRPVLAIHPETGVIQTEGATCFPEAITTQEALSAFFEESKQIAPARNGIAIYRHKGDDIYMLVTLAHKDTTVTTYYPAYHYSVWEENTVYHVAENRVISSQDALDMAAERLESYRGKGKEPILAIRGDRAHKRVVVDIAPSLDIEGIKQNVLFEISLRDLPQLTGYYSNLQASAYTEQSESAVDDAPFASDGE